MRISTRIFSIAAILLASASASLAQTQSSLTPLKLQLDWKPTAQFAGILVALHNGYYRQQGLDVTLIQTDTNMEPFNSIASSTGTIGLSEAESLIVERAKGTRVQAFATLYQTTPFSVLTLKESGLTAFKSLKGKRIGLYGDGRRAINVLLHFNGMTESDVTLVEIPFSLDPLIQGQVDAMQGYSIDEAVRLSLEHHPVNIIPMSQNGYISYAEVLFASPEMIRQKPDTLVRFLRATRQGWLCAIAHQPETARMIVETFLPGGATTGSVEEQQQSLAQAIPLLNAETHDTRFGQMSPETWRKSIEMFPKMKDGGSSVRVENLVDFTILDRLYGH